MKQMLPVATHQPVRWSNTDLHHSNGAKKETEMLRRAREAELCMNMCGVVGVWLALFNDRGDRRVIAMVTLSEGSVALL